jgi:sRNA-binding carbon storage regulator CsrA
MEILEFKNEKTGEKITIWEKLNVKVISVDEKLLRINFEIV